MGECIVSFYRSYVKDSWKQAFYSAVVFGLLVHLYKFTNNFPFFDSYFNAYSSQHMVASGRWFLSAACAMSSFFDLPWINGIMSVLFIGLTAVVLTEIYEMNNPCLIIASSCLLASFPAVTETLFFEYTADGYMLAMLLSALAVYFSRMECYKSIRCTVAAAACICLSCGIYQAYISFSFILAVSYFINKILEEPENSRKHLIWIVYQAGIYILGLVAYYVIWKIILLFYHIQPTAYQGIDGVGAFHLRELLFSGLRDSFTSFVSFLFDCNPIQDGWTMYSALNAFSCAVFLLLIANAVYQTKLYRYWVSTLLLLLCVVAIPFGCCIFYFCSSKVVYFTRMMQSVVILYIFIGILCDRWLKGLKQNLVLALLVMIIANNSVMANVCYYHIDRGFERAKSTMNEISTRIHMVDEGTAKYIAFIGTFDRTHQEAFTDNSLYGTLGPLKKVEGATVFYHSHMMQILSQYTDFTLQYYRIHGEEFPLQDVAQGNPVPAEYEWRFPAADTDTIQALQESELVAEMGIWPGKNCIRQIGDTIVIKLS